jgi:hypothetical protein
MDAPQRTDNAALKESKKRDFLIPSLPLAVERVVERSNDRVSRQSGLTLRGLENRIKNPLFTACGREGDRAQQWSGESTPTY